MRDKGSLEPWRDIFLDLHQAAREAVSNAGRDGTGTRNAKGVVAMVMNVEVIRRVVIFGGAPKT